MLQALVFRYFNVDIQICNMLGAPLSQKLEDGLITGRHVVRNIHSCATYAANAEILKLKLGAGPPTQRSKRQRATLGLRGGGGPSRRVLISETPGAEALSQTTLHRDSPHQIFKGLISWYSVLSATISKPSCKNEVPYQTLAAGFRNVY